jgi:predicted transcriptional regulator
MQAAEMNNLDEILISLKPEYADQIFKGAKTVELRRRRLKIRPGTRVWIYATTPTAAIRGYASLVRIEAGPPHQIWKSLGGRTSVSKGQFDSYFESCQTAYGLVFVDVMEMEQALPLGRIRDLVGKFHPPQFYCHLNGTRKTMRLASRKYRPVVK